MTSTAEESDKVQFNRTYFCSVRSRQRSLTRSTYQHIYVDVYYRPDTVTDAVRPSALEQKWLGQCAHAKDVPATTDRKGRR